MAKRGSWRSGNGWVERYPETEADRFCCDPIRGRVTITLETGSRNLPSNSDRTKAIRFGFGASFRSSTRLALALIVSVVNGWSESYAAKCGGVRVPSRLAWVRVNSYCLLLLLTTWKWRVPPLLHIRRRKTLTLFFRGFRKGLFFTANVRAKFYCLLTPHPTVLSV